MREKRENKTLDDLTQITERATFIVVEDLLEREKKALREILEFLVPDKISISWQDVVKGYSKERTIERIMKGAEDSPLLTSLRMRTIYTMFKRCYELPPKIGVSFDVLRSVDGNPVDTRRH